MTLKDLYLAFKFLKLLNAVYIGVLKLKHSGVGDKVYFSGVRLKVDNMLVEIRGEIVRLE